MSILLVNLVPQGIIFGADRNIHSEDRGTPEFIDGADGKSYYEILHRHYSQAPRPKVLRWPKNKALVGYAGEAQIKGVPTDEWLYDFIGDHLEFKSFETLAESLRQSIEAQRRIDEGNEKANPIIIHLAGFEEREGIQVPAVWVIRNDHNPPHLTDIRKEFLKFDCLWEKNLWNMTPQTIRGDLSVYANKFNPFWFHQGIDLGIFNLFDAFLKAAIGYLHQAGSLKPERPQSLEDWERQMRMSILVYGAYFQAYQKPYEQYVGGGVDTVSIPWPE